MCTPIFIVFAYFLKASRQSICVNEDMDRLDVVCLLILKLCVILFACLWN